MGWLRCASQGVGYSERVGICVRFVITPCLEGIVLRVSRGQRETKLLAGCDGHQSKHQTISAFDSA